MKPLRYRLSLLAAVLLAVEPALAEPETDPAGMGTPFTNRQSSLGVNYTVDLAGIYPSRTSGGAEYTLGFVRMFGGTFGPALANGAHLPVASNDALFSLFGANYGGDGRTTFGLPDLRGRAPRHAATPGGLGALHGSDTVTLTEAQMPAHAHAFPVGGSAMSGTSGGSSAFSNGQPTLDLNYIVNVAGPFPAGSAEAPFLGQIGLFAGNFAPGGWLFANGQTLPVAGNDALFSLLGTTYGGDGRNDFALPDLRGRIAVGAGAPGWALGTARGTDDVTLSPAQLAAHDHLLPGGATTAETGGGEAVPNVQPSLAVNFLIAADGLYPSRDAPAFGSGTVIGEIVAHAGTTGIIPTGFLPADGRLLSPGAFPALFSLLGTNYGGDGRTTFALPDLRGRTPIGIDALGELGDVTGLENVFLGAANLPAHAHTVPVPAALPLLTGGLALLGLAHRRRRAPRGRRIPGSAFPGHRQTTWAGRRQATLRPPDPLRSKA